MTTVNLSTAAKVVYITNGTVSGNTITYSTIDPTVSGTRYVDVDAIIIEDSPTKEPIVLPIPVSPNDQERKGGSNTGTTWIIDLIKIKRIITVTGHLSDDGTTSAFDKKQNLIKIMQYGGTFTLVWRDTSNNQEKHTVNAMKYGIKEMPSAFEDSGSGPASTSKYGYDVMLQFIVGTDRGG